MYWFNLVISSNTKTLFSENISKKSEYLLNIFISLVINEAIWAVLVRYINIKLRLRKVKYTIKASTYLSNTALANSCLLINSICLVVGKALAVV